MKLKVCGMKLNIAEVAQLRPDYLGFIFWEPSSRYFDGEIPVIPHEINKIGVFVDADVQEVIQKIAKYRLQGIQLHGNESPEYCKALVYELKNVHKKIILIKVFSITDTFDFSLLSPYEAVCDHFLFDTKGKLPGGNGFRFDWKVLNHYPSTKPYFLSGGIGIGNLDNLEEFMQLPASKYCHALDVNSGFELEPGLKKIEELKELKKAISTK
ncbi:phosphoribosylanthranilate isomerase [Maribacter sp. X9]|uniref:phosphoribosylanthranilate isomerase n=1 Tax=Maribacter sp. X9 TaxID=3402159 RepID=UPI003AF3D01F